MFLVAVTTTDILSGTNYVYLHPVDRRFQLSPVPEPMESRHDAALALWLAAEFFDEDTDVTARYITITGPDGPVRESYRGPADEHYRLPLVTKHEAGLAAGYSTQPATTR